MTVSYVQGGYTSGPGPTLAVNLAQPIAPGNTLVIAVRIQTDDSDPLDTDYDKSVPALDVSVSLFGGLWSGGGQSVTGRNYSIGQWTRTVGLEDTEPQVVLTVSDSSPEQPTITGIEAAWYEMTSDVGALFSFGAGWQGYWDVSPGGPFPLLDTSSGTPFRGDVEWAGVNAWFMDTPTPLPTGGTTYTGFTVSAPSAFQPDVGVSIEFGGMLDNSVLTEVTWDEGVPPSSPVLQMTGGAVVPNNTALSLVSATWEPGWVWADPSAGNLLVLTMWILEGIPYPPASGGWNRAVNQFYDTFVPGEGGYLVVDWKVADGTETFDDLLAIVAPAVSGTYQEVTGFTGQPALYSGVTDEFTDAPFIYPTGPGDVLDLPGGDVWCVVTAGFTDGGGQPAGLVLDPVWGLSPYGELNRGTGFGADCFRAGPGFGLFIDFGTWLPGSTASGAAAGLIFVDGPPPPPPPPPAAVGCCPKSIRACAMRLTRLNRSGVPVDPLALYSRIQTAGFMEVSLSPDIDGGNEEVTTSANGSAIALIDRSCHIMKGLKVSMKLCGVSYPVLEMLLAANYLGESPATMTGGALAHGRDSACQDLVMVELWSKNVAAACDASGTTGKWIHWLLPRTLMWDLAGSLSFSNGPLEFEVEGYAERNPAWYPSLPSASFPSWEPGGGSAAGWPTGPSGPVLPIGVTADEWTLADQEVIRASGPLVWRCVDSLPEPLSDCAWLEGQGCTPEPVTEDFCGPSGPLGDPWGPLDIPWIPVVN